MNNPGTTQDRPQRVPPRKVFWYWLKFGFISFGGPAGQIAIMHQDLVEMLTAMDCPEKCCRRTRDEH